MSYIINNSRGQVVTVVADGTVNTTSTDLSLVGRGLTEYGEFQNENYMFLLENFANSSAPLQPVLGQLWYNSATDELSAYNSGNVWAPLATQVYVQAQKASPAFTGIPTAPTAAAGTSTSQIATTAFVTSSPQFTGTPTAPTAAAGTNSTRIATTAYVDSGPQFTGAPTAPTLPQGTETTQLATTEFVTRGPQFSGIPTAPTAANAAANTQIATTQFVQNQKVDTALSGAPTAPTPLTADNSTRIATTQFVQLQKVSPALTGVPTAPTASAGTSNTQIATTQFVVNEIITSNALGTMSRQDAANVNITGGNIQGLVNPLAVVSGGTGANTAADARINLGLGNMAVQNSSTVSITGGTIAGLSAPLDIPDGGTGATSAFGARTNLGLGSLALQDSANVNITGGTITGISITATGIGLANALAINSGGTGADNVVGARNNLGLGSMAVQNNNTVAIVGGTINNITSFSANNVSITSGIITGITDLSVADGGTGASSAAAARTNLGAASSGLQIITGPGLTGGGTLTGDMTISIATNSNGSGVRYVSASNPFGGSNGDIWYQI
jgi:hypothetical protein